LTDECYFVFQFGLQHAYTLEASFAGCRKAGFQVPKSEAAQSYPQSQPQLPYPQSQPPPQGAGGLDTAKYHAEDISSKDGMGSADSSTEANKAREGHGSSTDANKAREGHHFNTLHLEEMGR
jgi:hypothetical protein